MHKSRYIQLIKTMEKKCCNTYTVWRRKSGRDGYCACFDDDNSQIM